MLPQLFQLMDRALSGIATAQRVLGFWGPVVEIPAVLGPLLAVASVLMLALLTGVAVGSLATLITALMALYLLLTEVFGVSIDVNLA